MAMTKPEQLILEGCMDRKRSGSYFTPDDGVRTLVNWAVRRPSDRMLIPRVAMAGSWLRTGRVSASSRMKILPR